MLLIYMHNYACIHRFLTLLYAHVCTRLHYLAKLHKNSLDTPHLIWSSCCVLCVNNREIGGHTHGKDEETSETKILTKTTRRGDYQPLR